MIMHVMCIEILASEKTRLLSDFIYVLPLANSRNISGKKRKHTHTHTHILKKNCPVRICRTHTVPVPADV